jgi:hypothetical protein
MPDVRGGDGVAIAGRAGKGGACGPTDAERAFSGEGVARRGAGGLAAVVPLCAVLPLAGDGIVTLPPHPEHVTLRPANDAGALNRLPQAGQANESE